MATGKSGVLQFWALFPFVFYLLLPQASAEGPCDFFLRPPSLSTPRTYSPTFSRNWLKFSKALAKAEVKNMPGLVHQYNLLRSDFKMDELLPDKVNHLLLSAATAQGRLALNLLATVYDIQNRLQIALWAKNQKLDQAFSQILLRLDLLTPLKELELARPYIAPEVINFDVLLKIYVS